MHEGTQRQAVVPARAAKVGNQLKSMGGRRGNKPEVGDVDISVADGLVLAPLQQCVALRAPVLHQRVQWILPFTCWIENRNKTEEKSKKNPVGNSLMSP
jgi:hypothetical protein